MNNQYAYENIHLWQADAWKERYSPIRPLVNFIQAANHRLRLKRAKASRYAGRTDGQYTFKTRSVTYADVVQFWDSQGLTYRCDEMGDVNYIVLSPRGVKDPAILLVLYNADYSDPNWAMDTVEQFRAYNELAARAGLLVLYIVADEAAPRPMYTNILQELSVINRLSLERVYLDVSPVLQAGAKLSEVPGFAYVEQNGQAMTNPDAAVEHLGFIPVLNITRRWQNKVSHTAGLSAEGNKNPAIDVERIIHSACGKRLADGMRLEHDYEDALDPKLLQHWQAMGIRYESHDKHGVQWVSVVPLGINHQPEKTLPVMLIFQEVTYQDPFQPLAALSSFYGYLELAAQGELMLLFFALETPDDNDLLIEILQDAAKIYPLDKSRVYVTGHSHNGHLCMEFMRRHHGSIAAVASLGNAYGLPAPAYSHEAWKVTDAMVDLMRTFDMPVIDICGACESDFSAHELGSEGFSNAVDSWQRRLKAFNCPMKTYDEIAAAKSSPDLVTRIIGVPNDRTEIQYRYGCECYIADVINRHGKHRLRLVAIENLPHMVAPQMPELSWDFVRRFARNLDTGEVIERF